MSEAVQQKILLTSLGTRGDMEPFIAIGEALRKKGHEVVYCIPVQFGPLLPVSARFHPLSGKFIELIESAEGRQVMGKSGWWTKLRALFYLYRKGREVNRILVREQSDAIARELPDLVIYHPKCSYPVLWSMATGKPGILLSAVPYVLHPVKGHAHVGFPRGLGSILNRFSYALANYGFAATVHNAQKDLPGKFDFSRSEIKHHIKGEKIMYTISPTLFARPNDWPDHAQVVGFYEREKTPDDRINPSLDAFLRKHPKPLLLTFGSMVNSAPGVISEFIYRILTDLEIPTIVNTASGGLLKLPEYEEKDNFYFAEGLPYDYVMEQVHAVIHHGGSGTTHTALKHACPTLIIPHIIDQFAWNRLVHKSGAGPLGIPMNKLPSGKLKALIRDLYTNPSYLLRARGISSSMKAEHRQFDFEPFLFSPHTSLGVESSE